MDANNAVARGSARGEGRPTESADNKLTQVSQKPKSKNQEKKHANTRTRTRVAKNRDQVLDKDKPLTDKEKKKLATKAKNSRKSSAYHVAFNKAIKDGCDEEEAKVRAKKALCLLYFRFLLPSDRAVSCCFKVSLKQCLGGKYDYPERFVDLFVRALLTLASKAYAETN